MLTPEAVNLCFYALASLGGLYKISTWLKSRKDSSEEFRKLQIRYFSVHMFFNAGLILQGPYVYKLYIENGLSSSQIAQLQALFNLSAALFGFFVGPVLDFVGHRILIFICISCSMIASVLRGIGGYLNFLIAIILVSFCAPMNKVAFEDWFFIEESLFKEKGEYHFTFSQNSAIVSLIISILSAPIGNQIALNFNTSYVFFVSVVLMSIAVICTFICIPKTLGSKKSQDSNGMSQMIKSIKGHKENRFSAFLALDILYGIVGLIYLPRMNSFFIVPNIKYPLASISGIHNVCTLFGSVFSSIISPQINASYGTLVFTSLSTMFFFLMSTYIENKSLLLFFLCCVGVSDGGITSTFLGMKKYMYPSENRARLLGVIKFVTSLVSSIVLIYTKKIDPSIVLIISSVLCAMCSIVAIIMINIKPTKVTHKKEE